MAGWARVDLKKARWSLNSAIHGLRKLLGVAPRPLHELRYARGRYYRLSPTLRVTTDVDELDERYEKAGAWRREPHAAAASSTRGPSTCTGAIT